jgi:hypothetical protein
MRKITYACTSDVSADESIEEITQGPKRRVITPVNDDARCWPSDTQTHRSMKLG